MSFERPFARSAPLLLGVLLVCGVLALPRQVLPEERMKRPVSRIEGPSKVLTKIPGDPLQRPPRGDVIPLPAILEPVPETIPMEFWLEWTTCQIHRVNDDSPIEAILSGSVTSSRSIAWSLTNTSAPGEPPMLSFVEDVFGRSGPAFGSNIGLTWEISIDGGAFQPMEVHSENILSTIFPPGAHTFQVRITGLPQYNQSDGYYRLRLAQNLAPQL